MFAEDVFIELLDEWNTSGKVDRDVQKLIRSLGKINNGVDPETFFINQLGKHNMTDKVPINNIKKFNR